MKKSILSIGLSMFLLIAVHAQAASYSYYVPYYASLTIDGQTYWTGIALRNASAVSSAVVDTFVYDRSGTQILMETKRLQPKGQDAFVAGSGLMKEGWILVESTQPLTGVCFIAKNEDPAFMFNVNLIRELSELLHLPHIAQDDTWDTTIMVCNPNDESVDVTLTAIRDDGTFFTPVQRTLSGRCSAKYALTEFIQGEALSRGSMNIEAGGGIAATALFSNLKTGTGNSYAGISAVEPVVDIDGLWEAHLTSPAYPYSSKFEVHQAGNKVLLVGYASDLTYGVGIGTLKGSALVAEANGRQHGKYYAIQVSGTFNGNSATGTFTISANGGQTLAWTAEKIE